MSNVVSAYRSKVLIIADTSPGRRDSSSILSRVCRSSCLSPRTNARTAVSSNPDGPDKLDRSNEPGDEEDGKDSLGGGSRDR